MGWGCDSVAEHLSGMHKAKGLNPITAKRKEEVKEGRETKEDYMI